MTGSIWRKWDLHFHSQSSYDYKDKSTTNQNIIDVLVSNKIEAIVITDHHTIDTARIKQLQSLGAGKVTILPGIEFRAELGGSESVHFIAIFSETSDIDDIWIKVQSKCEITPADIQKRGGDALIHCDLKETCKLVHELGGIVSVHAGAKTNTIENITNTLPYKMALKTDLVINHIDVLELGKKEDAKDYLDIVFPSIKKRLPMVCCSDNHEIKSYSVKTNLWIKADPTFEGLKQILFEPQFRIHVGDQPPIDPPIRINKVTLNFPMKSRFENETFCFSGKKEMEFSPNFTCIIGGRGTGKSTILNLIHEKLRPGENRFFKERKIKDASGKVLSINDCVAIDNDADEKYIEFLSQNEVEEFAHDYQKLTNSVYSRILKRDDKGLLTAKEARLTDQLALFFAHIEDKKQLILLKSTLDQRMKELGTNKKIVDSFTSDEYLTINQDIKNFSAKLNDIKNSHKTYFELLKDVFEIIEKYKNITTSNSYNIEIDRIIKSLENIVLETRAVKFTEADRNQELLSTELDKKRLDLNKYLSDKGLTQENLKDIANANLQRNNLEIEIEKIKQGIAACQKRIDGYENVNTDKACSEYVEELKKQLKGISEILERLETTSVRPISLQLEFDYDAAFDKIFTDFKEAFQAALTKSSHKGDAILKEILFSISPKMLPDKDVFVDALKNHSTSSTAKTFLIELLKNEENFGVYKLITKRAFYDYTNFKKIKVLYDNRPIENSSFGQRCTAVLVILLLLGNNPIIIDEPEAHLDSLLISNYLVEVIKDKKQNRQIIFATHNANFVINGDADLIHILDIDEKTSTTSITSTTIENDKTRERLISLEGGPDAFIKRENRYQFVPGLLKKN